MMAHAAPARPYQELEGRTVDALIIGDYEAVRVFGVLEVLGAQRLRIGEKVVPMWRVLSIQQSAHVHSAFQLPDPWGGR